MKEKKRNSRPIPPSQSATLARQQNLPKKIYAWLPVIPYLDRSTSAIAYLSIACYFLFTAYVFFTMPRPEFASTLYESPLSKNSQVRLLPGERYSYLVSSSLGTAAIPVIYEVKSVPTCAGIFLAEQAEGYAASACISRQTGNALDDLLQLNSSTGNQSFLVFSPWMLAVSENFLWQTTSTVSAGGLSINFPVLLRSFGKRALAGRDAYEVSASSGVTGLQSTYYIDAEKRVLLLAKSGNLTVQLVSAPFVLNWSERES